MKAILLPAFVLLCALSASAQHSFDVSFADSTFHMKPYWFVLYTRGDAAPLDSAAAADMQRAHLEHQGELMRRGLLQVMGPFADDGDWRGILVFDVDSKEEVAGYLRQDPFVQGGQLNYEIHPWYGAVGTTLK
jgi:uncharacterized protein YciI